MYFAGNSKAFKRLNQINTVTTAFYLNNEEAKHELNVYNSIRLLAFCSTLLICGEFPHISSPSRGIEQKTILICHTAEATCRLKMGCLLTAALSLVYFTADYCAPVWRCCAYARFIDSVLYDAVRIVTGCLRLIPIDNLPILSSIQPAELWRLGAKLSSVNSAILDLEHMLTF